MSYRDKDGMILDGPVNEVHYSGIKTQDRLIQSQEHKLLGHIDDSSYGKYPKFCTQSYWQNGICKQCRRWSGAVWSESTLFALPLSILWHNCIKSKIKAKIVWNNRAKMALYRSPDYQTSLSQLAFQFNRSLILIFKMAATLDFQSEQF